MHTESTYRVILANLHSEEQVTRVDDAKRVAAKLRDTLRYGASEKLWC